MGAKIIQSSAYSPMNSILIYFIIARSPTSTNDVIRLFFQWFVFFDHIL